ncbi:hypothetical protein LX32DRAFT_60215 [Colletotrichum zoysiae]|uniref:Uncharacterized protein n=1 Tax=Colletotrichum zoysiae TaxID=1216348 RepID=A0AAD9HRE4_9PEZI|nr:hypothetical protein LX32DRAFT_60215 [Colletotrichum zoysiae]
MQESAVNSPDKSWVIIHQGPTGSRILLHARPITYFIFSHGDRSLVDLPTSFSPSLSLFLSLSFSLSPSSPPRALLVKLVHCVTCSLSLPSAPSFLADLPAQSSLIAL